jgi:cysteine-rich repeat protein
LLASWHVRCWGRSLSRGVLGMPGVDELVGDDEFPERFGPIRVLENTPDARPPKCGDGFVDPSAGEACDQEVASATCNATCTLSDCGDGTTNAAAGEQCDPGSETWNCDADCTAARCGDGHLNAVTEACDDGNTEDGDECTSQCALP